MNEIQTSRLILRPLSMTHCSEQYVSWLNDPAVYAFLESRGGYSLDLLRIYIKNVVDTKVLMWAIHLRYDNLHIGNLKIDPVDRANSSGEYGILMGERDHWGKGYAREASEAVIDYCFTMDRPLEKITLGVVRDNTRAVELYRSMGFIEENTLKDHSFKDGKYSDVLRMAIFNK